MQCFLWSEELDGRFTGLLTPSPLDALGRFETWKRRHTKPITHRYWLRTTASVVWTASLGFELFQVIELL